MDATTRDEDAADSESTAVIPAGIPPAEAIAADGPIELTHAPDGDERLDGLELHSIDAAERLRFGAALADLDRLIAQVERGGIGVLPLRQALVSIRNRLRS